MELYIMCNKLTLIPNDAELWVFQLNNHYNNSFT